MCLLHFYIFLEPGSIVFPTRNTKPIEFSSGAARRTVNECNGEFETRKLLTLVGAVVITLVNTMAFFGRRRCDAPTCAAGLPGAEGQSIAVNEGRNEGALRTRINREDRFSFALIRVHSRLRLSCFTAGATGCCSGRSLLCGRGCRTRRRGRRPARRCRGGG